MSIKIKTISTVQLPPPKCRKNLFHVVLTRRSKVRFAPFFFTRKTSARFPAPPLSQKVMLGVPVRLQARSRRLAVASSCGAQLWLRRINRLTSRRPPRQQILAVSCTADARMCCQLFASYEGSNPTTEIPEISFSCGLNKSPRKTFNVCVGFLFAIMLFTPRCCLQGC